MKKLLLILLLLIPFFANAQKIKESKIDDFTGQKVIYTSWENIKKGNGMTGRNYFKFRFRYQNEQIYLHVKWITAAVTAIRENSKLVFKLSNNEMFDTECIEFVISGRGKAATGLSGSALEGIDPIYQGDFSKLDSENYITKFRINTSDGYVDIDLKEKDAKKINIMYKLLLKEINK